MSNLVKIKNTETKIILTEPEKELQLAKSMVIIKPSLVKIVDCKKIKSYTEEEKELLNSGLITYILSILGLSDSRKEKEEHYLAVDLYILEELSNYTYEEIKEAFKMYIKGVFSDNFDKIIYKLDCVILAQVMKCYDAEKIKILRYYKADLNRKLLEVRNNKNEPTEKEKKELILRGLQNSFKEYQKNSVFNGLGRLYLYDYLFGIGLLPKDKITKSAVLKIAKRNLVKNQKIAITKKEKELYKIYSNNKEYSNPLISECKRISLIRFFDKFTTYEQLLRIVMKNTN